MPETRKMLFLGASFAGLGATHYFLKHLFSKLPVDKNIKYEVVVVSPSSSLYAAPASPLTSSRPDLLPIDKLFADVPSGLKQYGDNVRFLHGKAIAWDEQARTVQVAHSNGETEDIPYWALVLATGTKTAAPHFSLQGNSHEEVQAALRTIEEQIGGARNIVIAGGGASAVESAGEIGERLNGAAGWFRSRPSNPIANVTIITSGSKLLPALRESIAKQAEVYLNRVGVDVRYNTKVTSATTTSSGKTHITLHDGEELDDVDLYIPATGVRPMTSYVPAHLKDSSGYVVQNARTLRVDNAGPRVYAVGDVGDASNNSIPAILDQVPVVATNLHRDLVAAHHDLNGDAQATGRDREYVASTKETQLVPIGRSKGVGAIFGYRVPSFFVWLIKGRTYMISSTEDIAEGKNFAKEVAWKAN